jgi:hypothetical protein
LTGPLPDPEDPEVIVIQPTLLVAVQLHPVPDVTATLDGPPMPPVPTSIGETPNVQVWVAAAWVTVTVWPAMVIVPVRELAAVFVATE